VSASGLRDDARRQKTGDDDEDRERGGRGGGDGAVAPDPACEAAERADAAGEDGLVAEEAPQVGGEGGGGEAGRGRTARRPQEVAVRRRSVSGGGMRGCTQIRVASEGRRRICPVSHTRRRVCGDEVKRAR